MKTTLKLLTLLVAMMTIGSCTMEIDDNQVYRNIVYFIDGEEHHETLTTEGEWDQLLDKLLDYTVDGSTVVFYNADLQSAKASATKKDVTFSTRDRKQMKDWCKKMEKEGMTVTITYDRRSGEWTGTANKSKNN